MIKIYCTTVTIKADEYINRLKPYYHEWNSGD